MTKPKSLRIVVNDEWLKKLDNHINGQNRSQYVRESIEQRVRREGGNLNVPAARPHGVRDDSLPNGWLSPLYRDRYQLVAVWNDAEQDYIIHHLHQYKTDFKPIGTIRADKPFPVEVNIIKKPDDATDREVAQAIKLATLEFITVDLHSKS